MGFLLLLRPNSLIELESILSVVNRFVVAVPTALLHPSETQRNRPTYVCDMTVDALLIVAALTIRLRPCTHMHALSVGPE